MPGSIRFASASNFSPDTLADVFTRSFEGYYYAQTMTAAMFAARIRSESLDLHRSLVMLAGDTPAGIAVLGLRAERAWCGGFGVMPPFRGSGLAHRLVAAFLDQAREAGARACALEVLTRNERAIKTYLRAGFQIVRDLRILEWHAPGAIAGQGQDLAVSQSPDLRLQVPHAGALVEGTPARLLERFSALHPVPAAWQRDLPALLVRGKLRGLGLPAAGERAPAYALLAEMPDAGARIEDLGAERVELATELLQALQRRYARLISVNEPADSPLTGAFEATGFVDLDRQHELIVRLDA